MNQHTVKLDAFYQRLGIAIQQRREARYMTQEDLASDIGMTRGGYAKIESGYSRVSVHGLMNIAHFLGCDAADLLREAEQR